MGTNLTYKILQEHLVEGELLPGEEIGIRIDQCLTQDATGTTAFLLFEAMKIPRVKCELAVSSTSGRSATHATNCCRSYQMPAAMFQRGWSADPVIAGFLR